MTFMKIFSLSAQSTNRLAWMDYAKGIAITMVVLRHITIGMHLGGIPIDSFEFEVIDNVGVTLRMPLFFLLSGIFFRKSIEKRSETGYVLHKSKTILYPYLIWATIATTLQIVLSEHVNTNVSLWSYLDIFVAPTGHWWFLVALFNISVLYLVMYLLTKGHHAIMLIIGLAMYFAYPYAEIYSIPYQILRLFIFFVIGDIISKTILSKENQVVLSSGWLLIMFLVCLVMGETILFQEEWRNNAGLILLFALGGSGAIIWTSYRLSILNISFFSILRTVGQHSLYVYLLHSLVGAAIRLIFLVVLGIDNFWIILPISLTACIVLPIYVYRISMNFGFWYLFSPEPPAKPVVLKPVNT